MLLWREGGTCTWRQFNSILLQLMAQPCSWRHMSGVATMPRVTVSVPSLLEGKGGGRQGFSGG